MYLVLDTNIIYDHWYLQNGQFQLIARFCENTDSTLLLPRVVIEEVDAKFAAKRIEAEREFDGARRKLEKFLGTPITPLDLKADKAYSFESNAKLTFPTVKIVEYSGVDHWIMVKKAVEARLPFRESEKGYRDCLLWLSLLSFLEHLPTDEEVVFITRNSNDFYDRSHSPDELKLKKDLQEDIDSRGIRCSLVLFQELRAFIDKHVDERAHGIGREHLLDKLSSELDHSLATAAIEYLVDLPKNFVTTLLLATGMPVSVASTLEVIDWVDVDLVEDRTPLAWRWLNKGEHRVFVDFEFDMRIIEIVFEGQIEHWPAYNALREHFYDMEVAESGVSLKALVRGDFVGSVAIRVDDPIIENVEIESASIRLLTPNSAPVILRRS